MPVAAGLRAWGTPGAARVARSAGVLATVSIVACAGATSDEAPSSRAAGSVALSSSIAVPDSIVVDRVRLRGTLELPTARCAAPQPVVLIIAGSGPTDRDGNSGMLEGENNSLRMLAEGLAANCIASLRYDKRGVGQSVMFGIREEMLSFSTFADDAAAWIRHLRADPRFGVVVVVGHSEGAMLGTLAARAERANGLVLIAGAGRPVGDVLREQLRRQTSDAQFALADSLITELEAGRRVANPPGAFATLFRPSVQPYLISWLPLDPVAELARVDMPTLVVWGTSDLQAGRDDAERLAAADDDVRLVVIEDMNHVLKAVSGTLEEQLPSYSDPTLPLHPALVPTVVAYVRQVASP